LAEVRRRGEGFVWIGLYEPDLEHMQQVAGTFGLHPLAVEDAVCAHQRPKLERYDHSLFMVIKTVHYIAHESPTTANEIVETGEIMAFLGKDFIITVRHGQHSGLHGLRRVLEAVPDRLKLGPAAVLHAWQVHYGLVRRSLEHGFFQGWDLYPAQLVTRYAAVYGYPVVGATVTITVEFGDVPNTTEQPRPLASTTCIASCLPMST
ncbi:DUF6986 family protein, partial [Kibdelosporangium lantanae]